MAKQDLITLPWLPSKKNKTGWYSDSDLKHPWQDDNVYFAATREIFFRENLVACGGCNAVSGGAFKNSSQLKQTI